MNEQLDPQLSRLFSNYAPVESPAFLEKLQSALDRAERHARWRNAVGWGAMTIVLGVVATFASGPLGALVTLVDDMAGETHTLSLESLLPFRITPLSLTLATAVVALCLHRRIRAMLAP